MATPTEKHQHTFLSERREAFLQVAHQVLEPLHVFQKLVLFLLCQGLDCLGQSLQKLRDLYDAATGCQSVLGLALQCLVGEGMSQRWNESGVASKCEATQMAGPPQPHLHVSKHICVGEWI